MFICDHRGPADIENGAGILETEKVCSVKKKKEGFIPCEPVGIADCRHDSRMDFKGERAFVCPWKKSDGSL